MKIIEDKIISEFLNSLGPWSEHITIGGGFALFIYKLYLADKSLKNYPVGTRDIDSLIPRKLPHATSINILTHLKNAGFKPIYKDVDIPALEAYTKEIEGMEVEIEFLTDTSTRGDKNQNILIGGIVAQPLSYLTLSLKTYTKFETYSGEIGRVVSPGAWVFHKGLTFIKRNSSLKKFKDLYGIWYVTSQLGNFSNTTLDEFIALSSHHHQWYGTFKKNLIYWLENASPQDWSNLEYQDPSGLLNKINFKNTILKLLDASSK